MKSKTKQNFILTGLMFAVFAVFTLLVKFVDVQQIGPAGSSVGFASVNGAAFKLFGQNAVFDKLSDLCLLAALLSAVCFAALGVFQLIKRKSFFKVDCDLYALAGYYVLVAVFYLLFELILVNQRPVLVDGVLEASYPSSHTLLVCSFMLAAIFQSEKRVKNKKLRTALIVAFVLLIVLTAAGRLLSGMHWLTDVLGGLVLGSALGMLYLSVVRLLEKE
ncbi:MAG: phosphatase PAP2 family protein [Oscillospiraceae bacterium]|nr:phosphatase PAP2 family protein [Oscillospiraceae bacterium]